MSKKTVLAPDTDMDSITEVAKKWKLKAHAELAPGKNVR